MEDACSDARRRSSRDRRRVPPPLAGVLQLLYEMAAAGGAGGGAGAAAAPPLPPELDAATVAARFIIGAVIGVGKFGVVCRARDTTTGVDVAVKRAVDPGRDAATLGEIALMASVPPHPRVAAFIAWWVDADGHICITMGLAAGGDATQYVNREIAAGRWGLHRALRMLLDIADGLAHLHAHGVWHRDIKPENILVDAAGRALLGDLGLARQSSGTGSIGHSIKGSPLHFAAEIMVPWRRSLRTGVPERPHYSASVDVWSLSSVSTPFSWRRWFPLCQVRAPRTACASCHHFGAQARLTA